MTIRWPCSVLRSRNIAADIAPRSLAAPASVSGISQVVASDAGIWKVTLGEIVVRKREHVLAFRAVANLLEGRLGTILVPICRAYQPVPNGWRELGLYVPVPHSDDAPFDDDAEYQGGAIFVTVAAPTAARAVSMSVNVASSGEIQAGQHFSVGERLYRVRSFDADTGIMTFRPPLRDSVAAGSEIDFDDPVCRMRLASDQEMDLDLQMRRFGQPTVSFIEAL